MLGYGCAAGMFFFFAFSFFVWVIFCVEMFACVEVCVCMCKCVVHMYEKDGEKWGRCVERWERPRDFFCLVGAL